MEIKYFIESSDLYKGVLTISGWASSDEGDVELYVVRRDKTRVKADIRRTNRMDVSRKVYNDSEHVGCGFEIRFQAPEDKYYLIITRDGVTQKAKLNVKKLSQNKFRNTTRTLSVANIKKAIKYLKLYGFGRLVRKLRNKAVTHKVNYPEWLKHNAPSRAELEQQKKKKFEYEPKISIIVPAYKTPEKFLKEMIESVTAQTYANWELCIADGSADTSEVENVVREYMEGDSRIKYVRLDTNKGISGNTNAALDMAKGDFVALLDHDDLLTEDALFEVVSALNKDNAIEVLYSDEDKVTYDLMTYFEPHMKPDFNIDLLRSVNYICHLFVVKDTIIKTIGGFDSKYDGAQDHDFILRAVDAATKVHHIPKVLYHWRCHQNSTAENPESKLYAYEAGKAAVAAHLERHNLKATVSDGVSHGIYRVDYQVQNDPLISIIIPNKDHIEDLEKCIRSIDTKSDYTNYEYIIVENNSTEPETFEYYNQLQRENKKVKVIYWDGEFNFAAINNFGVKQANGDYLLFLNNDTEIINADCLRVMLGCCQREDVGIVGARLYYQDDIIQHAGVIMGFGGIAGHAFMGQDRFDYGYFSRAMCMQDYSAVTAACLMTKRSVFDEVGGYTEKFKVAFNDIDFCCKVREKGHLVVYNPYAELYHYESKSRGAEDTPEKIARFSNEVDMFHERWSELLKAGDPYYNPNLTLSKADFSLKSWKE